MCFDLRRCAGGCCAGRRVPAPAKRTCMQARARARPPPPPPSRARTRPRLRAHPYARSISGPPFCMHLCWLGGGEAGYQWARRPAARAPRGRGPADACPARACAPRSRGTCRTTLACSRRYDPIVPGASTRRVARRYFPAQTVDLPTESVKYLLVGAACRREQIRLQVCVCIDTVCV